MGIAILEEAVASKIAAGEVIERPASVVKELVENSLDAGARRLDIEIREAGRALIRVTDDGAGMSREDAVLAVQRYATSKIARAEDLFAIETLGFRGEALPSIAAVSHFTLTTRRHEDSAATRLSAVGGEVTELEEVGAPPGTEVSVSRLFYNTPARLKFLRRDATETAGVAETVTRFLFSHPHAACRLRTDGREILQHGGGDLRGAVVAAWGREIAEAMLPVQLEAAGVVVRGLVSPPSLHRASRTRQFLYVNHRWIRSRMLAHALEEAYRGSLPDRRSPLAVLMIELEPSAVDVNVHPTKAEVRLSREREIHHFVLQAVRDALGAGAGPATVQLPAAAPTGEATGQGVFRPEGTHSALASGWTGTPAAPGVLSPAFQQRPAEALELRPLAQLRQTYILAESRQGLLVVDQHRAHERVLYERFAQERPDDRKPVQRLLTPTSVELGSREAAVIAEHIEELQAVGFELEPFGGDAYLVRAVPQELARWDASALLRDIAEELSAEEMERSMERRKEKLLATLSCRSAVKAGDSLTWEEMTELLEALGKTSRPYTCPHGWPIVMTISNLELDRKFNR